MFFALKNLNISYLFTQNSSSSRKLTATIQPSCYRFSCKYIQLSLYVRSIKSILLWPNHSKNFKIYSNHFIIYRYNTFIKPCKSSCSIKLSPLESKKENKIYIAFISPWSKWQQLRIISYTPVFLHTTWSNIHINERI